MKHSAHLWRPCIQMKDDEIFPPLYVKKAKGSYLYLDNKKKVIDAISSWWCKSLGHQHPALKKALLNQLKKFEHVILANTVNETILDLSEKLSQLIPELNKVFYAGDGSCAVEIALKKSLHSRQILGETRRTRFIALQNGYHGETTGALSVSDLGLYKDPYRSILFDTVFIPEIPYISNTKDPLWQNCHEAWTTIEKFLEPHIDTTTAIILEPIVQGAGYMKIYSQDFLKRLSAFTKQHNIHLIADECMTGIGRTGKMLACEHAGITPDFICLSKSLTSGWMPLSAVLTRQEIYDIFYDDYLTNKTFLHSHTYCGNPLAASVASKVLDIMKKENYCKRAVEIGNIMKNLMTEIQYHTDKIKNIRQIGAICAADLVIKNSETPRRFGFEVFQKAAKFGALLRPLGNTIYWLPPLNIELDTLCQLKEITEKAIKAVKF